MDDYISLSMLNDYIFCPYSIYLHNVYANTDEEVFGFNILSMKSAIQNE